MTHQEIAKKFSPDELFQMSTHMMKKHDVASIWLHWFNVLSWVLLLFTGIAMFSGPYYHLAPKFVYSIALGIFGSKATLLKFHIFIGILWILVLLPYGIFGFRNYLFQFFRNDLMLDWDDIIWMIEKPKQILGLPYKLPPQGVYNAGQKMFGMVVAIGVTAIILSGLVMAFHLGPPILVRWAVVLHFIGVFSIVSGLVIHIYMAAILPEERPAFFSMFTGKVNELYAYLHHYKWWQFMKKEEGKFYNKLQELYHDGQKENSE